MPRRSYVYVHRVGGPILAGELTAFDANGERGGATFRYEPSYLEHSDAIPVDPIELPIQGATPELVFATAEDFELFGGIRDAVPDNWGQGLIARDSGRTDLKLFDYLVAAGDERVGALAFGPDKTGPKRVAPWSDGDENEDPFSLSDMIDAVARLSSLDTLDRKLRRFLVRGSSLGGARPKATTIWDGYPAIAKFEREDDKAKGITQVCRLEFATMKLAQLCGIDIPPVDIATVAGLDVYLIRRFDRVRLPVRHDRTAAAFWRRHFVSGLTILAAHESEAQFQSYRALADRLRRLGSKPKEDCRQLYRRMLFNILCNNTDDHLRNHGFLYDGRQKWRLSPAYDINPFPEVGDEARMLSLGVGRDSEGHVVRHANLRIAMTDCRSFYYSVSEARALIEEMYDRTRSWKRHFAEQGLSEATIERVAAAFLRVEQIQRHGLRTLLDG